MSKSSLAGAAALVAAPIAATVGTLAKTTASSDAATQVTAFADHRGTMIAGIAIQTAGIVLFIGGIIWLSTALAPRFRNLAVAGGIVAVAGSLVILFEDGIDAALPTVVSALGPDQATTVVDRIQSSAAVSVLEPFAILQAVGLVLLAFAVSKAGAARWAAVALAAGGIVDTVGFGAESRPVIVAGFAVLLAGLVPVVYALTATSRTAVGAQLGARATP